MKDTVEKYCNKKAVQVFFTASSKDEAFRTSPIAICIPIYNEYPDFFKTLRSLHLSALSFIESQTTVIPVSIVCCVNSKKNDDILIQENNAKMIYELQRMSISEYSDHPLLNLVILDNSSEGRYFSKNQGVGLARKTCMDYAILRGSEVLACLDADTLVSIDYVKNLQIFYILYHKKSAWALTNFSHQKAETSKINNAINHYEKFLYKHSTLLKTCKTPYYSIALGPTIICTSISYVAVGGMNTKCAGEDFYFLQSLIKLHLYRLENPVRYLDSCVYPSARLSSRVLFGTGTRLQEIISGKECHVFNKKTYKILKDFISIFNDLNRKNLMDLFPHEVSSLLPSINPFLEMDGFWSDWQKIYKNHRKSSTHLENAFHDRFDGLKIIRLFHFLEETMQ